HAMIDRAVIGPVHDNSTRFERRLVEVHRVAIERMGKLETEHCAYALSKLGILVSKEDEDRWPPGRIGRHVAIKAKTITTSAEVSGGVWQAGKVFIKQGTHCFHVETAAQFASRKKCCHETDLLWLEQADPTFLSKNSRVILQ